MAIPDASALYQLLVDIEAPMDDIIASLPYVIPALILGLMLLFYQRHLPRDARLRNLIVFVCILAFAGSFLVMLYAGFGSRWYGPTDLPFGSWGFFTRTLQLFTDVIFGSVLGSILYVVGVTVLFAALIHYTITPPEPDVVSLREELRLSRDEAGGLSERVQSIEAENKRLNQFLSEREESLTSLEGELESIKAEIQEREASIAMMEEELGSKAPPVAPAMTADFDAQLVARDQTIDALTRQVESLRSAGSGDVRTQELQQSLEQLRTKWEDLTRRAETAAEVSEAVISDLVDLISLVEASKKDDATKRAIVTLIEALGRSMTRLSRETGDSTGTEPPVTVIGAILMVNETVDAIKKIIRS